MLSTQTAGTTPVLAATGLRRTFGKEGFVAVDDLSLSVEPGQVHALLGPNGAGKTTTVRMCATLLTPTVGQIQVDGIDAVRHPEAARARVGLVLGGELGFYPRASARDNLLFFADLQGLSRRRRRQAVDTALERMGLADVATRKAGAFSRGMLQRLHLARALLGSPPLLLLNEPTTGLDPDVALQVRDLIRELAADGTEVLLTSHSMPEVEELADLISVIGAGRIVTRGTVRDLAAYAGIGMISGFTLPARHADAAARLQEQLGDGAVVAQRPASGRWAVTVYWAVDDSRADREARDAALAAALAEIGTQAPADLVTRPASLEEAYLALADRLAR
ncbi:ABC-2 type transport system ATP-binding protein [Actinomyces ruminicola]|uniref:ABC-2 type transport system ATP-binding protein n=1 Tax=Actinomyces ruminicola TaxID=332524 RepID=A0A1H0CMA0_9ACTO|nr:ABC transporter ATP-binding protein [Actinomyces ruminicola]SDN59006.1 ABC-2 type transport system ATP-binding protein [Actinomyces ruminicola]